MSYQIIQRKLKAFKFDVISCLPDLVKQKHAPLYYSSINQKLLTSSHGQFLYALYMLQHAIISATHARLHPLHSSVRKQSDFHISNVTIIFAAKSYKWTKSCPSGCTQRKKIYSHGISESVKAVDDQNTLIVWTCANMFNKLLERWSFA